MRPVREACRGARSAEELQLKTETTPGTISSSGAPAFYAGRCPSGVAVTVKQFHIK